MPWDFLAFAGLGLTLALVGVMLAHQRVGREHPGSRSRDILLAVGAVIAIALVATVLTALAGPARAGELQLFPDAHVFGGIDHPVGEQGSVFCEPGEDPRTGSLGVSVTALQWQRLSLSADYTHHSCAWGSDAAGTAYDGVGFKLRFRLW